MASRSLQTQMAGVQVAGQNLANVNTPGYSRQQVVIQTAPATPTSVGPQGNGANLAAIQQITDALLNTQIQGQSSVTGYWNQMQNSLQTAQTALNEYLTSASTSGAGAVGSATTSTGLSDQINAFFSAAQAVATSPTSIAARQSFTTAAQSLATSFNQVNSGLSGLQTSLNSSLTTQVSSANQLLSTIANLNNQISLAQNANGGTANDLLDQREQALESLSGLMNVQTSLAANGSVTVTALGGSQTLVSGSQVVNALKIAPDPTTGQPQVWSTANNNQLTGLSYGLTGGSMEATVNARDGTLASMQSSINSLASNLITQVNTLYSAGYSLTGTTGANFFTGADASSIGVNQSLVTNPSLIQASSLASPIPNSNNSVAAAIAQLAQTAQSGLNNQTFSASYTASVATLGNALSNANNQATNQTSVASMLSTQRASVSGVNLDEEMTNMMKYQQAYQASAQLVTTINAMMTTINAMKST
jgi:flagellar hook-associated protein 1 FlgK